VPNCASPAAGDRHAGSAPYEIRLISAPAAAR